MKNLTKESLDIIVSVLVNEKIEAEENNKNGINNEYIISVNKALEELKQLRKNFMKEEYKDSFADLYKAQG